VKPTSFNDEEFARQIKQARSKRLAKMLADLVDLKVKGIITEQEFSQRKRKLLGF
jgi:biotin carboxylase